MRIHKHLYIAVILAVSCFFLIMPEASATGRAGQCGPANGAEYSAAPTKKTDMCRYGSPTTATLSGSTYNWVCQGSGTSGNANCSSVKCNPPENGQCGSANGTTVASRPTSNLCSRGSASAVSGSGPWNWSCDGQYGGSPASCSANRIPPVNGQCGSANGTTVASRPTSNLCSRGSASAVSGSGPWNWSCAGQYGGSPTSCSANKTPDPVNGQCGSANGTTVASAPSSNLCSRGSASAVSGSGPWNWSCAGQNGGSSVSCSANKAPDPVNGVCGSSAGSCSKGTKANDNVASSCGTTRTWQCRGSNGGNTASCSKPNAACPTPINGSCGSSHNTTVSSKPTSNLCNKGNASTVSGSGPWSWSCSGQNGGTTASCNAEKAGPPPGSCTIMHPIGWDGPDRDYGNVHCAEYFLAPGGTPGKTIMSNGETAFTTARYCSTPRGCYGEMNYKCENGRMVVINSFCRGGMSAPF